MKIVIQRVEEAQVKTEGEVIGRIGRGLVLLLGVGQEDTEEIADKFLDKILRMRIFEDENGKTNLSIKDVDGELLIISQFTLYADLRRGNRPGFTGAGSPQLASRLYEYFVSQAGAYVKNVKTGRFGADMKVSLTNDGPFTIVLDDNIVLKK